MSELLEAAINAHGGVERWNEVQSVDMIFNWSGALLPLKGLPGHLQPSVTVDVREPRVVFQRMGSDPEERRIFTPEKVWIENGAGDVVEERQNPRHSFEGHTLETKWDRLHATYFGGYAIWNYLLFPFVLAQPGFQTRELGEHQESHKTWRVLEAVFPDGFHAHTKVQKFYFGPDFLLRRIDYKTDVAGGVAAHYCFVIARSTASLCRCCAAWFRERTMLP